MTKKEMVEAMLAGKRLVCNGWRAYYNEADALGPFVAVSHDETKKLTWHGDADWNIEKQKTTRLMTRDEVLGFVANTLGIIVRHTESQIADSSHKWSFNNQIEEYQWARITKEGVIGEWHLFTVEVEE